MPKMDSIPVCHPEAHETASRSDLNATELPFLQQLGYSTESVCDAKGEPETNLFPTGFVLSHTYAQ